MEKIPTAFDFWVSRKGTEDGDIVEDLKEFAKLHVEAALKAVSEKAQVETKSSLQTSPTPSGHKRHTITTINKDSILTAYPLDLIC